MRENNHTIFFNNTHTHTSHGPKLLPGIAIAVALGFGLGEAHICKLGVDFGPDGAIQGGVGDSGESVKTTISRRCAVRAGVGTALKQG